MADNVQKIKSYRQKAFHKAWGAREIAEGVLGDLKVADSFLYLYQRFGKPNLDSNDEYKISYEYKLKYQELVFTICATTPELVYVDCFMPGKFFRLQRNRYRKEVRKIFDRAAKDGILTYPWSCNSDVMPSLTKKQQEQAMKMFMEELNGCLGEENKKFLDKVSGGSSEEDKKKAYTLHEKLWKHLFEKFRKWAGDDKTIHATFWSQPDLRYLPEVEKIVRGFCNELLQTLPIRDCDINIKGWQ